MVRTLFVSQFHLQTEVAFMSAETCSELLETEEEDTCLYSCLIDKFIGIARCIHPRLKIMLELGMVNGTGLGRRETPLCDYHLLRKIGEDRGGFLLPWDSGN